MKIKLTNQQITDLYAGLQNLRLGGQLQPQVSLGYALVKDEITLKPLNDNIVETLEKMALRHGSRKSDGTVQVDQDYIEIVNAELAKYGEEVQEIDLATIPYTSLADFYLPLDVVYILYPLIEDNDEV